MLTEAIAVGKCQNEGWVMEQQIDSALSNRVKIGKITTREDERLC